MNLNKLKNDKCPLLTGDNLLDRIYNLYKIIIVLWDRIVKLEVKDEEITSAITDHKHYNDLSYIQELSNPSAPPIGKLLIFLDKNDENKPKMIDSDGIIYLINIQAE